MESRFCDTGVAEKIRKETDVATCLTPVLLATLSGHFQILGAYTREPCRFWMLGGKVYALRKELDLPIT